MRTERETTVEACPHPGCQCRTKAWVTGYTCDQCGIAISREDYDGDYAHELSIALDMDECVSFLRLRDYCPSCLDPIWQAVCKLIGGNPDEEREEGREQ